MNPEDRIELSSITDEQKRVHELVRGLDQRIDQLSRSMERAVEPAPPLPVVMPPPLPPRKEPPVPKAIPICPAPLPDSPRPLLPAAVSIETSKEIKKEPAPEAQPKPEPEAESLEIQVGTYWLVRIGIVVLLTGFVFLGNYAYQHVVPLLGAWGKLSLITLAGGALTALGAWLERRSESLGNYARVLSAGGMATLYYAAYAAHFVDRLRVIESPVVGGLLLLIFGGGMIWHAERRRSESTAVIAILLSYYTAAINPIGNFTLFSNLILTAVGVFLLLRQRWLVVSYASIAASYACFEFWRIHQWSQGSAPLSLCIGFLASYWILFTVGGFFCKSPDFSLNQRTAFLTANNAALASFGSWEFLANAPSQFWIFALSFGVALLALTAACAHRFERTGFLPASLLMQGISLVTAGIVTKLSGPQISVTLALECAALLTCARWRFPVIFQLAAGACAITAFGIAMEYEQATWANAFVAVSLVFNGWWVRKALPGNLAEALDFRSLAYVGAGLFLTGSLLDRSVPDSALTVVFAGVAVVGLVLGRQLRFKELAFSTQFFLPLSAILAFWQTTHRVTAAEPLYACTAIGFAVAWWWMREKPELVSKAGAGAFSMVASLSAAATLTLALQDGAAASQWMVTTSLGACALLFGGILTRTWTIALASQMLSLVSCLALGLHLFLPGATWYGALAPIANLAVTSIVVARMTPRYLSFEKESLYLASAYRSLTAVLTMAWVFRFVAGDWVATTLLLAGALQLFAGLVRNYRATVGFGLVFGAAGLIYGLFHQPTSLVWPELFAIASIPASLRLGTRIGGSRQMVEDIWNPIVGSAVIGAWWWITRGVLQFGDSAQLTATWSLTAFAIFAAGMLLRERIYRLAGLMILGLAVGRVFFVDVWRLETLFRILSFLVLGTVLLVLGFVYNRFSEAMKRWL